MTARSGSGALDVAVDGIALVRGGRMSRRGRERRASLVLAVALLAALALSLLVGSYAVSAPGLVATLLGSGEPRDEFVVLQLRLPRATLAALVGAGLGLSGALFQSVLRNPLASPDVIGISQGASLAAVAGTLAFGLSGLAVSLVACLGALLAAAVIVGLSWRSGLGGYRFVLVGIGLAFAGQGVIGYLLTRSDVRDAQAALVWMVGSVGGARWPDIAVTAAVLAALAPFAWFAGSRLKVLQLGDETAAGLGISVDRSRLAVIAVAAAIAAVAIAAAGPVAFVAFVAAPLARRALGTGGLALIPSALVGALLVVLADFAGQHLLPGEMQVPVGILTGLIGAPYLLWLLTRSNRTPGATDA